MLPAQFGKRWQLFTVTPLSDFTSAFERNNTRLLFFGLIAIAAVGIVIGLRRGMRRRRLVTLA